MWIVLYSRRYKKESENPKRDFNGNSRTHLLDPIHTCLCFIYNATERDLTRTLTSETPEGALDSREATLDGRYIYAQ